ncbi:MAG: hypothetical protein KDB26_02375 [Microthrixaceae bacterium]|nr:hypothetical protein [Microthrixaceae bacterium]
MTLVYLDANVLVPSYTRTLLIMAAPLSNFTVCWSLHAEAEAERHQSEGAVPISMLRARFGWDALVPDGNIELEDTDIKDRPILSAAALTGASFVVTENMKDFGQEDLVRLRMSAVHPDLFLAHRLSVDTYREVLGRLAKARTRLPNTAADMHRDETGERLPLLARRMRDAYEVTVAQSTKGAPSLAFRGVRCVSCDKSVNRSGMLVSGVCSECEVVT